MALLMLIPAKARAFANPCMVRIFFLPWPRLVVREDYFTPCIHFLITGLSISATTAAPSPSHNM